MTSITLNESATFIRGHRSRNRDFKRQQIAKRPWYVIDGEGITVDNDVHLYVQFQGMASDTQDTFEIVDHNGINGYRILHALIYAKQAYPKHIFVIYGGSYDFNMWLKQLDLSRDDLERIYKGYSTRIGYGYRVKWRRGKMFTISLGKTTVTIYDVVSFFQCTFIKACDSYLGDDFYERELIVESKAQRGDFTTAGLSEVSRYNYAELVNLARLMDELRDRLYKVGLYPSRWDGPGAIAAYLLKREGVKNARAECPEPVAEAARYAYAGGRFEVVKFGHFDEPAYEYDRNSAYPTALLEVPNLAKGFWVQGASPSDTFSLYKLRYKFRNVDLPAPLFRRLPTGVVHFPSSGTGWHWRPEYEAAKAYVELYGGELEILDSWTFIEDNPNDRPFAFIRELYAERQALKAAKDGAQVGIKLALNSLYGKLAQQIGWRIVNGEPRIPPFHQLEWAGYVTAHCRAAVFMAGLADLDNVIAYETDALFTRRPLNLDIGEDLGQWGMIPFENLTYLQSGTYYGESDGKQVAAKTRGIDRGKMTRDECLRLMSEPLASNREVTVQLRRFHTLGIALNQDMSKWCKWLDVTKRVSVEPTGKRLHSPFCQCSDNGLEMNYYHETICPTMDDGMSVEYPVEWLNPNAVALMEIINELRAEVPEWEPLAW